MITTRPGPSRVAGTLMAVQAVALVALTAIALVQIVAGHAESMTSALTEAGLALVFAALAALLAVGLLRAAPLARTPTLVWNVLLLPVGVSMISADQLLLGVGLLALAVVTIVAALLTPAPTLD